MYCYLINFQLKMKHLAYKSMSCVQSAWMWRLNCAVQPYTRGACIIKHIRNSMVFINKWIFITVSKVKVIICKRNSLNVKRYATHILFNWRLHNFFRNVYSLLESFTISLFTTFLLNIFTDSYGHWIMPQ